MHKDRKWMWRVKMMMLRLISGRPTRIIGWHSDGKRPIMGHEMMRFVGIYERWSRDEDA